MSALRSWLAPVGHSALPIDPEEVNDDCRIEQQDCDDGGDHAGFLSTQNRQGMPYSRSNASAFVSDGVRLPFARSLA